MERQKARFKRCNPGEPPRAKKLRCRLRAIRYRFGARQSMSEMPRKRTQNSGIGICPDMHLQLLRARGSCNFSCIVDEKLSDGADRAVLQGDNSEWHAGVSQLNWQDLNFWTLGKSQY
jgi:hypothetical protein